MRGKQQTYQLVEIPPANGHVTLLLIHAPAEVVDIVCAGRLFPGGVGCIALPQAVVHGLALGRRGLLGLGGSAGAAAKETTDSVTDRRTDCYTTVGRSAIANGTMLRKFDVLIDIACHRIKTPGLVDGTGNSRSGGGHLAEKARALALLGRSLSLRSLLTRSGMGGS